LKQLPNYKQFARDNRIRFQRISLLKRALTHSSYQIKNDVNNEQLEFLGDAVLELIVRDYLLKKNPQLREGELSELKKNYTSTDALARVGHHIKIGQYLIMDKGEAKTGGRNRKSNLANSIEALIGALYLDRGLHYTARIVHRFIMDRRIRISRDCKSLLNQWVLRHRLSIDYRTIRETGPLHRKCFHIALYIDNKLKSRGKGSTKKQAEQNAARCFLRKLRTKN
jgi:ribonuclease-3